MQQVQTLWGRFFKVPLPKKIREYWKQNIHLCGWCLSHPVAGLLGKLVIAQAMSAPRWDVVLLLLFFRCSSCTTQEDIVMLLVSYNSVYLSFSFHKGWEIFQWLKLSWIDSWNDFLPSTNFCDVENVLTFFCAKLLSNHSLPNKQLEKLWASLKNCSKSAKKYPWEIVNKNDILKRIFCFLHTNN